VIRELLAEEGPQVKVRHSNGDAVSLEEPEEIGDGNFTEIQW